MDTWNASHECRAPEGVPFVVARVIAGVSISTTLRLQPIGAAFSAHFIDKNAAACRLGRATMATGR